MLAYASEPVQSFLETSGLEFKWIALFGLLAGKEV